MKELKPNKKCYCGGPESCNICKKDKIKQKALKKKFRQNAKQTIKNTLHSLSIKENINYVPKPLPVKYSFIVFLADYKASRIK